MTQFTLWTLVYPTAMDTYRPAVCGLAPDPWYLHVACDRHHRQFVITYK